MEGARTRYLRTVLLFVIGAVAVDSSYAQASDLPLLAVLTETGTEQGGLPVYALHPAPDSAADGLSRGLSGLVLRVYRMEQRYLKAREGIAPEPAYVLLSGRQGGFAREGFVLGEEAKPNAGYVDVHRNWPVSGTFGAIDQIVPHELAHVMRRQLAGELRDGGTNQVHALGLRTDRVVAFNEGFAEHLQAVAFDRSPDVLVFATLAADTDRPARVYRHLETYRQELTARLAPAPRMRLGFIAWYANGEDVLRYHGVRDNAFAREPLIPERLLSASPYRAYLLESVLPGAPDAPPKSLGRMAASEGVVAAFFYRWAMDERIGARRLEPDFYVPFGVTPHEVTDLENTYLKMIEVLYVHKPQTVLEMIAGYVERFPEEQAWIDSIATAVFHSPVDAPPPELWMANRDFQTGTTLFDQFRGLPRTHTFDLNAASLVDLVSVSGVSPALARRILADAPYAAVDDVRRVEGVSEELAARFAAMHAEMDALRDELASETEESLSITALLTPMLVRALVVVGLSAVLGLIGYAWIRRRADLRPLRRPRLAWNGLAAGSLGSIGGWIFGLSGLGAVATVVIVCGVPAALIQLVRGRRRASLLVLGAWALAAVPAALLTGAWL